MLTPTTIFWSCAAFAFVFGALIGSFLNVVIYRVPEGLSVVTPGSRCPSCGTAVRWYDNIPIVSWFILRGKCRQCGTSFSIRYALVEALTGLLAVGAWWQAGRALFGSEMIPPTDALAVMGGLFLLRFTLYAFLVAITFIDLDHFIIPHRISLPGIALGLASPWITQLLLGPEMALRYVWPPVTPGSSLAGAIAGFLVIVGLFYAYFAVRGAEGIGGGDATLMALVGAWLGWPALIFVLFAASVQGVAAAGISMLFGGGMVRDAAEVFADDEDPPAQPEEPESAEATDDGEVDEPEVDPNEGKLAVPFGPFIALAAVEFALFGPFLPIELSMVTLY